MSHKMFRYLTKYVGKYRVLARYDESTGNFPLDETGSVDDSFDDLYIPCKRGEIRASYRQNRGKDILCIYIDSSKKGKNTYKELKETGIWLEEDNCGPDDYYIYFNADDIETVAKIVVPRTSGKSIRPFSVKNLPKTPYSIPKEDQDKFDKLTTGFEKLEKAHLVRDLCSKYDERAQNLKGKKFNVVLEKKKSNLKPLQFIHSIGLWDDFIDFTKEELKK